MFDGWKGKVIFAIEMMAVVLIFSIIFNNIIHPILASIHPMFTPQQVPIENRSLRGPDTPAEVIGFILAGASALIYYRIKWRIVDYLSYRGWL